MTDLYFHVNLQLQDWILLLFVSIHWYCPNFHEQTGHNYPQEDTLSFLQFSLLMIYPIGWSSNDHVRQCHICRWSKWLRWHRHLKGKTYILIVKGVLVLFEFFNTYLFYKANLITVAFYYKLVLSFSGTIDAVSYTHLTLPTKRIV